MLAGLTVAGWLAWAAFVLSVLAEAVNLIGRRSSPLRIPLLGGFQSLVGALVVAVLSATAAPAMAAVPAVQPTGTKTAVGLPAEEDDSRDVVDETTSYRVRPGDDLWSVAEQLLGQGSRWRLLADANPALLANPTVDLTPGSGWWCLSCRTSRTSRHRKPEHAGRSRDPNSGERRPR